MRKGQKHTIETRKKIGLVHIGNKYNLGRKPSQETIEKIRKKMKGMLTLERRKNISDARKGIKMSLKSRKKLSESCKGRKISLEQREKIRKTLSGRKLSSEHKQNISKGLAKWVARWPKPKTWLEVALSNFFDKVGFVVDEQVRFKNRVVDAYDPENGLVWEADGFYWHQDKEKEQKRDEYLINCGIAAIIHLSEKDLLPWKKRKGEEEAMV